MTLNIYKMDEQLVNYFKGDTLAPQVWMSKYRDKGEVTPDDMHRRLARKFAEMTEFYSEKAIYEAFKDFTYIVPQGSVMAVIGTDKIASASNCFIIGNPHDSYGGIMQKDEEMVQLMKRRGGVGLDLSSLRPALTPVNNAALTSTGAVSFAHRYSNSTREVAQDGRRGALMLSLNIVHPDSLDFINLKQDLTKVTGANISLQIPDDFMVAVTQNAEYILRWPCNSILTDDLIAEAMSGDRNVLRNIGGIYVKVVDAASLYGELVKNAWSNAEPGQMFLSKHHDLSPDSVYEQYKGVTTNPCQPSNALVLTQQGIRTFGHLNIGDLIWSEDGWVAVANKIYSGVKPVYKFYTTGGYFIGTQEHKVKVHDKKIEVGKADELQLIAGPRNADDILQTMVMDGLVIGDGSKHMTSRDKVYLTIGEDDKDYFTSDIGDLIEGRHAVKYNAYKVITSVQPEELPHLPLRTIPDRYYHGSPVVVRSFLRGLYSANGSVVRTRVTLKSSSKELIDQVQIMLSSVGIRSYYTVNKPKFVKFSNGTYKCKESFDLNISTDRAIFAEDIGFIQKYKMEKLIESLGNTSKELKHHDIISEEYIGDDAVFDITVSGDNHTYWSAGINVSNCGEIFTQEYDSCRLMALNLYSFVDNPFKSNSSFNYIKFRKYAYMQQVLADALVDLELAQIDNIIAKIDRDDSPEELKRTERELWLKIRESGASSRRTGCGFTALGDTLAALGILYSSEEAKEVVNMIMNVKMDAELEATIELSKRYGPFAGWKDELEYTVTSDGDVVGANPFYQFIKNTFPARYLEMMMYGRRNVSWSTVAPTGTVSLMTQTTSGLEPVYKVFYTRRVKINPTSTQRVDFVDQNGDAWTEYAVMHPKFKEWVNMQNISELYRVDSDEELTVANLTELYTQSPWYKSEADDIDWLQRVEIQAIIQKYTSHSISSTINLPSTATQEDVFDIYMHAWKTGLKGITVYRDGSRTGVLVSNTIEDTFKQHDAPKRPEAVPADLYHITAMGRRWTVCIGLLDDKPYEVFASPVVFGSHGQTGYIVKRKKKVYSFESEGVIVNGDITHGMSGEEAALTRMISTSLRHGAKIDFVVNQLSAAEGAIVSFSKAIARALKKYSSIQKLVCSDCNSEDIVMEEGCSKCRACGSSKCG